MAFLTFFHGVFYQGSSYFQPLYRALIFRRIFKKMRNGYDSYFGAEMLEAKNKKALNVFTIKAFHYKGVIPVRRSLQTMS